MAREAVFPYFSLDGPLAKRSNISAAPSAIGKITDCWQEQLKLTQVISRSIGQANYLKSENLSACGPTQSKTRSVKIADLPSASEIEWASPEVPIKSRGDLAIADCPQSVIEVTK
jgi:hypothetical protein